LNDAGRRNQHLCREQVIAAAQAAGAKYVAGRERPSLAPDDQQDEADDNGNGDERPREPRLFGRHDNGMLSYFRGTGYGTDTRPRYGNPSPRRSPSCPIAPPARPGTPVVSSFRASRFVITARVAAPTSVA